MKQAKQVISVVLLQSFLFFAAAYSQTHFSFTQNTGNNATIAVPVSANPTINGVALSSGDEIGAFTPAGLCVGAVVWDGVGNKAITVWGDNDQTTVVDGIKSGEKISYHIWQKSSSVEYSNVAVTYSQGSDTYSVNGIYVVSSMSATGNTSQSHFTFTQNTGNNATVAVPVSANPTINGVALSSGDEIGAFTPAGLCVGAVVWDSVSNKAITVWGDNDQTTQVDGIKSGEKICYRIWKKSSNTEYSNVAVTYSQGSETYSVNGIYVIASIAASVSVPGPISLSVDSVSGHAGDTVVVPLRTVFPTGKNYSSFGVTLTGYKNNLQFLGADTASTLIGPKSWLFQVNGTDSIIFTASAGANDISGSGVLFKVKFKILNNASGFVPINIQHALFDTGTDSVVTTNGGVNVISLTPVYGDVDKNGQIQPADAAAILKYLVGIDTLDAQSLLNADVTNNGFVSALDATAILKYVVHLINSFPADSATMGPLTAQGVIAMNSGISSPLGSLVEVPLNLSQGNNILSFEGKIAYDPSGLSWQNIAWSSQLDNFTIRLAVDSTAGVIRFAGAGSLPDGNEGTFASLFFLAKKNGTSKITLEELRWNEEQKETNVSSTNIVTAVEQNKIEIPKEYSLSQNYPNPFNPSTTISYAVPSRSRVTLYIMNTLGQRVATLVEGEKNTGYYQVEWSPNVSSGIYFYRIEATSLDDPNKHFVDVKKLLLLK
ncbi:MAG: T9SS type A sorting domain-containing protein [Bacteroidota bacterium]|nr:T9SS type A sorting domain-containing protein [Bacteroidota bacterium]